MASRCQPKPVLPLSERVQGAFWNKAECGDIDDCWPWRSITNESGYGQLAVRKRGTLRAHRIAWALANGRDPGDLFVCHRCDNPPCVNPRHLFLGTVRDNWHDCIRKGRAVFPNPPRPYCRRGHEYTPENTVIEGRDRIRRCRECMRLRNQRKILKAKEKRNAAQG